MLINLCQIQILEDIINIVLSNMTFTLSKEQATKLYKCTMLMAVWCLRFRLTVRFYQFSHKNLFNRSQNQLLKVKFKSSEISMRRFILSNLTESPCKCWRLRPSHFLQRKLLKHKNQLKVFRIKMKLKWRAHNLKTSHIQSITIIRKVILLHFPKPKCASKPKKQ